MEYTYTEEDQVSQKSEFAGSVRQNTYYLYDGLHRRTHVGTNSTWWHYTYDDLSRVATQRFTVSGADILTETFTYNNANQVTSIQKVTPENTRTHSYTYDANGNIATVTVGNKTTQYFYDTAGQLVRENNETAGTTTLWTYDRAGNILTEKVYNYTTDNGTPSQLLEDNDYFYTSTKWGDLLTAYNGNMIYYDGTTALGDFKIGNPTTYYNGTHWTFTWEHGRQLATIQTGATTWTNTYNSDGLRTSRTNGTTTYNYYYEGSQLTSVSGSNGNIWIFYDGNRPFVIKYGDTATYHYELNLQGDVIAILDSSGNRVVEYTYDAWGNILDISGSKKDTLGQANPLRYRGYVYDPETQLYYLQSRYYDPKTHRFLNADAFASTGQGFVGNNMFAYCGNSPVNRVDPTGHIWGVIIAAVVIAVTFSACSGTSEYGAAEEYVQVTDPSYNCYAYALGETEWRYVGGNPDAVSDFDVYVVADMVIADVTQSGRSIRPIESFDSPIEANEYRIALRTGESDYHFMRQNSDGTWSHKPGWFPSELENGSNPSNMSWDLPYFTVDIYGRYQLNYMLNYYDSDTIYFAVSK